MNVRIVLTTIYLLAAVGSATAQPPGSAPKPRVAVRPDVQPPATAPAPAPAPRREAQPINVKVDVTISDQRGAAAPVKRTVSVIDVDPMLLADGKVRVKFNLQYDWPAPMESSTAPPARGTVAKTSLHDTVVLILESGKPMIAAQSADPIGDRQVTVEVKATILR
jgi:hypothetical protein